MNNATRAPSEKNSDKKRLSQKVDDFLRANRLVLFILLAVVVLAIASVATYSGVTNAQANASTARVEKLSEDLGAWAGEQDATKKAASEKTIVSGLREVTTKWPRQFAAARALSLLARIAETNKDWEGAEKDWMAVYEHFPKTFLAPVALQKAAAAAEERGANDVAIAHYQALVDKFPSATIGLAHALFAIGRLSEESKDYAAAVTTYQKLMSSYPDDDWTKLAKDRIIFLKAHGFSK
jgi:tetratricopeptide (TPR) repeat protein